MLDLLSPDPELICSHKIRAFSIFGGPSWAASSGDAEYFPVKNIFGEILVFVIPNELCIMVKSK